MENSTDTHNTFQLLLYSYHCFYRKRSKPSDASYYSKLLIGFVFGMYTIALFFGLKKAGVFPEMGIKNEKTIIIGLVLIYIALMLIFGYSTKKLEEMEVDEQTKRKSDQLALAFTLMGVVSVIVSGIIYNM